MPIDRDALHAKLEHVEEQLAGVRAKEKIVTRVGGRTVQTFTEELAFQQVRVDLLTWMLDATEEQIRARFADEMAAIGDGADALLEHGNVNGMPAEIVQHLAFAELCQLALGEHRAQVGGGE